MTKADLFESFFRSRARFSIYLTYKDFFDVEEWCVWKEYAKLNKKIDWWDHFWKEIKFISFECFKCFAMNLCWKETDLVQNRGTSSCLYASKIRSSGWKFFFLIIPKTMHEQNLQIDNIFYSIVFTFFNATIHFLIEQSLTLQQPLTFINLSLLLQMLIDKSS